MASNINVGTINVSYPVAGVNNNSQGFRDNFAGISNNLQTAATEITDLQSNVLLKAPLTGTTLDNDMSNGIIKNAQTLGFRASTYDLGSNLSGTVNVDITLGDVQIGTITGATTLTFTKWPLATGNPTYASVQVILTVSAGLTINLPASVTLGTATIEGYSAGVITVPADVTKLHFQFNTLDCGTNIEIVPLDRPRKSTQIVNGIPYSLATGTIVYTAGSMTVTGTGTLFVTELVVGQVITDINNIVIGTVASITNNISLILASNATVTIPPTTPVAYRRQMSLGALGDVAGDIKTNGAYLYVCSQNYDGTTAIWKRIATSSY